jgi:uncharacterized protein YggE
VAGILVAVTLAAGGAGAEEPAEGAGLRLVTSVGRAETEVAPDRAVLRLTVRAGGKSAGEAAKLAAARSAQALEALRGKLGPGDRAETAGTSLQPVYAYEQGKPPRITGYSAAHQLRSVTARIQEVGAVLDALTASTDLSIDSVEFELADPAPAQAKALALAARDARQRATAMAEGLGLALGPVHAVRELGAPAPRQERDLQMKAMAGGAAQTQVLPPQLHVRAEVEVSFELAPGPRP